MVSEKDFRSLKRQLAVLHFLAALQLGAATAFVALLIIFSILRFAVLGYSGGSVSLMAIYKAFLYAWIAALGAVFVIVAIRLPIVFSNTKRLRPFATQIEESNFHRFTRRDYDTAARFAFSTVELIVTRDLMRNLVNHPPRGEEPAVGVATPAPDTQGRGEEVARRASGGDLGDTKFDVEGVSTPIKVFQSGEPKITDYSPLVQRYHATWLQIVHSPARLNEVLRDPYWNGRIGHDLKTEIATVPLGDDGLELVVGYSDVATVGAIQRLDPTYHPKKLPTAPRKFSLPHRKICPGDLVELHYDTDDMDRLKALYLAIWRDFYHNRPWEFKDVAESAYWKGRVGEELETEVEFAYIPRSEVKVLTGYQKAYLLKHIIRLWNDTYREPEMDDEGAHFFWG